MFPLGSVLVPHQVLPLQVFEPRYLAMVERCLERDRRFGVVLIERGWEVGGGDVRFATGTVATIEHVEPVGDGRLALVAVGGERLRVREWRPDDPYPLAEVELRGPDSATPDPEAELVALADAWSRLLDVVRARGTEVPPFPPLAPDPVAAAWQLLTWAPITPLDTYTALAEDDPEARIARVIAMLADVTELLALGGP
jgi:Lon protease-like protein